MADYYTAFSFAIPLDNDEQIAWAKAACAWLDGEPDTPARRSCVLTAENMATEDDCTAHEHTSLMPELDQVPDDDEGYVSFRAQYEEDDDTIWVHADESGNVEEAARFVQVLIQKFRPESCEGFEWAATCSKPRLDAFGGGAVFVTVQAIEYFHSGSWLHERMAEHAASPSTPVHVWVASTEGAGMVAMEFDVDRGVAFRRLLPSIHPTDDVIHAVHRIPNGVFADGPHATEQYLREIGAF